MTIWGKIIWETKDTMTLKSVSLTGGKVLKKRNMSEITCEKFLPSKLLLKQESFLFKIRDRKKFGYVQCDLEIPDGLKYKFSNFPPIFKNYNISRVDIGYYMREFAIENNILKQLLFSQW